MTGVKSSTESPGEPTPWGPHCHVCGYDLRALPESGTCAECGTPYTPATTSRLRPTPDALHFGLMLGELGILVLLLTLGVGPIIVCLTANRLVKQCIPARRRASRAILVTF